MNFDYVNDVEIMLNNILLWYLISLLIICTFTEYTILHFFKLKNYFQYYYAIVNCDLCQKIIELCLLYFNIGKNVKEN